MTTEPNKDDIVERLIGVTDKYPGFRNLNTEAAAEIRALRERVADLTAQRDSLRRKMKTNRANAEHVPAGYREVEAWINEKEIVVLGCPKSDDESHNCDQMGCGSFGPHVIHRFPLNLTAQRDAMREALMLAFEHIATTRTAGDIVAIEVVRKLEAALDLCKKETP